MIPLWTMQAAAFLNAHEINVLLGAMGALWGTIVLLAAALWRIGSTWVAKINARVEAFPQMLQDAIDAHNKEDQTRHEAQMTAIQANANSYTAPWSEMQTAQALLKQRVENLEDTDRRPTPSRRKR